MDVLEKTADLAISIKESPEYSEFVETKNMVETSPKAREILKEYRARQFALELAEIAGEGVDEVNDALAEICAAMEEDVLLRRYLAAEFNLVCLVQKMQDIFAEKLGVTFETHGSFVDPDHGGGFLN
ncbi:MAG: YlbF family regulator [Firmicutes bacterium]|jgi:cell fate (sporulation/competence/biofilm development) regulator YlbF (YheA/YmcA/DUF963 family)|nr:YlbF family regulator [Bacillota bacterium]